MARVLQEWIPDGDLAHFVSQVEYFGGRLSGFPTSANKGEGTASRPARRPSRPGFRLAPYGAVVPYFAQISVAWAALAPSGTLIPFGSWQSTTA